MSSLAFCILHQHNGIVAILQTLSVLSALKASLLLYITEYSNWQAHYHLLTYQEGLLNPLEHR